MTAPAPNVSIIIPCYNGEPYLAQTIGSALEQRYPPREIIVVDDGSTDESASIARSFGDPVQVISKRCGGASKARNYGYRFATGDAIMFLDADDVLGPLALQALTTALRDSDIAICPWHRLEKVNGKWVQQPADCKPFRPQKDYLANWLTGWWHPPCSVLWARSAYESTGGWDQRAYINDDGELIMRSLVAGMSMTSTNKGAAYYRRLPKDESSITDKRFTRAGIESRIYAARKIARLLERENKIDRYRQPLRAKFEEIAQDCAETFPELHEECLRYADRYGESRWRKTFRRHAKKAARRILPGQIRGVLKRGVGKLIGADGPLPDRKDPGAPTEVRYGLETASKATARRNEDAPPSNNRM